jgi:pyridoxine/pyridoxamine 5'-phosphate oxidase
VPADVTAEIHGYSHPDATPTPWEAGREQVLAADTFWLSTVRPDGRPHVTPLIAVWHADAIWFTTGADERKARNLAENASCILTTGRSDLVEGGLDVVLEGAAEQVTDDAELQPIAQAFAARSTGPRPGTSWSATAPSATAL